MAVSKNKLVAFVQRELNARYGLSLAVDGQVGPKTMAALNHVSAIPSHFEKGRRFVAFIQYLTHVEASISDIAVDGLMGPNTEFAMEQLLELDSTGTLDNWRDNDPFAHFSRILATKDETGVQWPEERDLESFYGAPGTNWVKMNLPFSMRLAWDTSKRINRFSINAKIKPYAENMFEEVLDVYGFDEIQRLGLDLFAGSGNVRKIRGGNRYSSHSFAAALDIDSIRNKLRWNRDRAQLAKPEYEEFWKCVYRNGARSLLIERNYDAMHLGWYKYK